MANGGVDLDELLAARERINAEKARSQPGGGPAVAPGVGVTEDLTLPRLIGLWLLVTGLLILKMLAIALVALAEVMEWFKREAQSRQRPSRRRR